MLLAEKEKHTKLLIQKYGNNILRLCYLYTKDYHLAEDLTQDTFVKVYQNIENFRNESSEYTWITRIAINNCKNFLKKQWFQRERSPLTEINPEKEYMVNSETNLVVVSAIQELQPKLKEVIVLHYYQGFAVKEIANILNIKEGAVLIRLKRGRDKLKVILKEDFADD